MRHFQFSQVSLEVILEVSVIRPYLDKLIVLRFENRKFCSQ